MDVVDVPNSEKVSHAFEIRGSVKSFTVMASSAAEKTAWMDAIRNTKNALVKNSATLKLVQPSKSQLAREGSVSANSVTSPASRAGSYFSGSGSATLGAGFKMPTA
jgi:hypothetical protein